jgi:hypothetical protein
MTQTLGWVATALFICSYFVKPAMLRVVQMVAAVLWAVYGVLIGAVPVIAANILVFSAAGWTLAREYFAGRAPALGSAVANEPRC